MKRDILKAIVILISVSFIVSATYACIPEPPVPDPHANEPDPNDGGKNPPGGGDPVSLKSGEYSMSTQDLLIHGRAIDVIVNRRYCSSGMNTVYFNGSGSYSPGGTEISGYLWSFPPQAYNVYGAGTTHAGCQFPPGGPYEVCLAVEDSYPGCCCCDPYGWDYCYWLGCWCSECSIYRWTSAYIHVYGRNPTCNYRFGYGWDMSYNIKVQNVNPNTIALFDGGTRRLNYTKVTGSNPPKYIGPAGQYNYLIKNPSNTYTLHEKDGTKYDFDSNGNLSSITDRNGNSITFGYEYAPDSFGNYKLITITDDMGRNINLTYNPKGLLSTISDFTGRTWTYTYNPVTNDMLTVTSPGTPEYPSGLTTTYTYDEHHNLQTITDPNAQTYISNTYDSNGKVMSQVYGNGSYTFTYDPYNNQAIVTDRRSFERETIYNDTGNPISQTIYTKNLRPTDPNSYTTSYEYNYDMEITRKIFPAGNYIDYAYDANGNLLGSCRRLAPDINEPNWPPDINEPNITTLYTYEPNFNHVKTKTDPRRNMTTYNYDPKGNLTSIIYPVVSTPGGNKAPVVSLTYNSFGQVETATLPDSMVVKGEYYNDPCEPNNYGRLWKVIIDYNETNGLNITSEFKYDSLGRAIEVNNPKGNITRLAYNTFDQLTKITAPEPYNDVVVNFSYDICKKLSQIDREIPGPNQITRFTYNILEKLETMTDPLGYVTAINRDNSDNPTDVNDAEEHNTHYNYDERDLLWKVTDANGGVTEFSYTANGKLAEIKDANNNITKYDYDGFDRLICITYPDDSNEVFGYDASSNITSWKNRKGQTISYQYDALNRMTKKTLPGGMVISFTYDLLGRLVGVTDASGTISYSYDRAGRLKSVTYPGSKTVSYSYDNAGNRTRLTYPDGSHVTYDYDELNRLTAIRDADGALVVEYDYDALSRRIEAHYANGTTAEYSYDIGNRLLSLNNQIADANQSFDYSYNKVDARLTMTVNDTDVHSYDYDSIYQLTDVNYPDGFFVFDTTFDYDSLGNRKSVINGGTTNYVSNKLNQYISVGGTAYTYDKNGNLTNDGVNSYTYDTENRLITANTPQHSVTYQYDPFGRRIVKNVDGKITRYLYDGDQVICEYDGSSRLRCKFLYGTGIDEPIRMTVVYKSADILGSGNVNFGDFAMLAQSWLHDVNTPGFNPNADLNYDNRVDLKDLYRLTKEWLTEGQGYEHYFYHFDGLGNVVALTNDSGIMVENYKYDVYGQPNTTSSVGNPYLFTGREYDPETGLYYYRARYYNPHIGRFLQTDPLGYYDSMNLYAYCFNNPTNWVDPYGLKIKWSSVKEFLKNFVQSVLWNLLKALSHAPPGTDLVGPRGPEAFKGFTEIVKEAGYRNYWLTSEDPLSKEEWWDEVRNRPRDNQPTPPTPPEPPTPDKPTPDGPTNCPKVSGK